MANDCKTCGGRGQWREKVRQKFRVQDSKTKEWHEEWGEVWVDRRCSSCK